MSEGDSIHFLARRLRPVLEGRVPAEVLAPHPRHRPLGWPEKLAGRAVEAVEPYGKHLFVHFEGGLQLHSHLGMTGSWRVFPGPPPPRRGRATWLVLRMEEAEVVQRRGPVLELITTLRRRSDRRLTALGPDICAPEFDPERVVRRLRDDDPTRPLGDALLDQRNVAGIGNLWKVEGCWLAGISPWRPLGRTSDAEALRVLGEIRPRICDSALRGTQTRYKCLYGTRGRPCPRCGERVRQRLQGDAARLTYWCPGCQS